jgi:hypothetical protein
VRRAAALRPGDWVQFDVGEHQVLALAGTSVRLRSSMGVDQVVLASHLFASPGFAVTGADEPVQIEPFGLLDGLSEDVIAAARAEHCPARHHAVHRSRSQQRVVSHSGMGSIRRPRRSGSGTRRRPPSSV